MANVIPEDIRRSLGRRSLSRFVLAGSIVALVCALAAFLALLPSYFVLTESLSGIAPTAVPVSATQASADRASVTHTNTLLSVLAPIVSATTTPTDVVAEALKLRPAGVHVDQITYTAGSLMLVGSASTNVTISTYRSALAADPMFSSVSVPVGALAGTDGGRFSMTISGSF